MGKTELGAPAGAGMLQKGIFPLMDTQPENPEGIKIIQHLKCLQNDSLPQTHKNNALPRMS